MKYLLAFPILTIVGFIIWFLGFSSISPLKQKIISPTRENQQLFQITAPENFDVVTLSALKIAGKAPKSTFVAVFGDNDSQILAVGNSTEFSTNFNLGQGYNLIKFANFEASGSLKELKLEVFNLSQNFEKLIEATNLATESAKADEPISRLAELRKKQNLKIIAGTVKGILGKNLAVETQTGTKTVVVDPKAQIGSYPDFGKLTNFSQIQAGDFIVAVGSFAQQGILTAQVLLINPNIKPDFSKTAKLGIVEKIKDNILQLTNPLDGVKTSISAKTAKIFDEIEQELKAGNIQVGNKLAIVGKLEKESFVAEKIMVILGNFLGELEKFALPPTATQSATQSAQ